MSVHPRVLVAQLLARLAEAAFTARVVVERRLQVLGTEVGPALRAEVEFGVGALQQEEVGDAVFAEVRMIRSGQAGRGCSGSG
jgi:hypothetical protein